MVFNNDRHCPICNKEMIHYDKVKRIIRNQYGEKNYIYIDRLKCTNCSKYHRVIPDCIKPYKQYAAEIIDDILGNGVLESLFVYEDYPSELTMARWISSQKIHRLL
jgi:hypothetical protein